MTKVLAGITTSVDGYVAGPERRAEAGARRGRRAAALLGLRRARGRTTPRSSARRPARTRPGSRRRCRSVGAVVAGRWTYEAADHWGGENPWGLPFFIVTHRPEEQPEGDAFTFVSGVEEAVERAREAAGDKHVHVMGGADVIRQALEADLVDELTIIVAPVVLGGGKRPVRRVHELDRPRAHRRAAVAVRDIHRLSREAIAVAPALAAIPLGSRRTRSRRTGTRRRRS